MSRPPLLSVALPVYNGADYLEEALQSVLAQDFEDWELVVSDNASTDGTAAILARYAAMDPRIRVFRAEKTVGQVENVNRCVVLCSAAWVQFLCHDDLFFPGALHRLADVATALQGSNVALVGHSTALLYGCHWWIDYLRHDDKKPRPFVWPQFLTARLPADCVYTCHDGRALAKAICEMQSAPALPALTTAMVRRDVLLAQGGFDPAYVHFDVFGWMTLLIEHDYCWTPQALTLTRIHGRQVAAEARKTLRSVSDHRAFWPNYLGKWRVKLGLGIRSRLTTIVRPANIAAGIVGTEWRRQGVKQALAIFLSMPCHYWLLLPTFVARFAYKEQRRLKPLLAVLELHEVYP